MDIPTTADTEGLGARTARPVADRRPKLDALVMWTRVLSGALVVQLGVALWVLSDRDQGVVPLAAIAIAVAAPITGLIVEVLSKRQRCAIWSTGTLALLWLAQTALLLSLHTCGPITLALIGGFGSAVLLFVLCPMVIWPVHKPSSPTPHP
jgi:hypothetical protein